MDEKKKYDSDDRFELCGAYLAKDPEVREGANGKMVRLTFVSTSRTEGDADLWVEANVADRQAELAACLKKGDILHKVEGKPALRKYAKNDGSEGFSFNLRRASFVPTKEVWQTVKARGWSPTGSAPSKQPPPRFAKPKPTGRSRLDDEDADIPF